MLELPALHRPNQILAQPQGVETEVELETHVHDIQRREFLPRVVRRLQRHAEKLAELIAAVHEPCPLLPSPKLLAVFPLSDMV